MPVRGLDHVAITCLDIEATLSFYKRVLGATTLYEDEWRAGKIPVVLLQVGESRMSIHDAASPAKPSSTSHISSNIFQHNVTFEWYV